MKQFKKMMIIISIVCIALTSCGKHTHVYTDTVVPAAYNEKGYTLHKCSECGDEYKDNYTDELGWVETFSSYMEKHGEYDEKYKYYNYEKKIDSLIAGNHKIAMHFWPKEKEILLIYFFDYESITERATISLKEVREKYKFSLYYNYSGLSAMGEGYVSAKDIYSSTSLAFDISWYESTSMGWKSSMQKDAARYLKKLCKNSDEILKGFGLGIDLSYWGIQY